MASPSSAKDGVNQTHSSWKTARGRITSRHSSDIKTHEFELQQAMDGIYHFYRTRMIPTAPSDIWIQLDQDKNREIAELESKHQQKRKDLRTRHNQELDDHLLSLGEQVAKLRHSPAATSSSGSFAPVTSPTGSFVPSRISSNSLPLPESALERPASENASTRQSAPRPVLQSTTPDTLALGLTRPLTVESKNRDRKRKGSALVNDDLKRQRNTPGFNVSEALENLVPEPQPSSQVTQTQQGPPHQPPERTITYDQVRRNASEHQHWDYIIEAPKDAQRWYVLFCEQHQVRFKKFALSGAAKHLNGNIHKFPDRNQSVALETLGYRIVDCTAERQKEHNDEVEAQYAKGYEPENKVKDHRKRLTHSATKSPARVPASRESKKFGKGATASKPMADASMDNIETPLDNKSASHSGADDDDDSVIITNPKPFHVYYGRYDGALWPVLILGWDDQISPLPKKLSMTSLLDEEADPPKCYDYDDDDKKTKIVGWAVSYEDGGPYEQLREFPVMWFDEERSYGWVPVDQLSRFPIEREKPPTSKEPSSVAFNDARSWIATREGFESFQAREAARKKGQGPRKPEAPKAPSPLSNHVHRSEEDKNHDTDPDYEDDRSTAGGHPANIDNEDSELEAVGLDSTTSSPSKFTKPSALFLKGREEETRDSRDLVSSGKEPRLSTMSESVNIPESAKDSDQDGFSTTLGLPSAPTKTVGMNPESGTGPDPLAGNSPSPPAMSDPSIPSPIPSSLAVATKKKGGKLTAKRTAKPSYAAPVSPCTTNLPPKPSHIVPPHAANLPPKPLSPALVRPSNKELPSKPCHQGPVPSPSTAPPPLSAPASDKIGTVWGNGLSSDVSAVRRSPKSVGDTRGADTESTSTSWEKNMPALPVAKTLAGESSAAASAPKPSASYSLSDSLPSTTESRPLIPARTEPSFRASLRGYNSPTPLASPLYGNVISPATQRTMPTTVQNLSGDSRRGSISSIQQTTPMPGRASSVSTPQHMPTTTPSPAGSGPVTKLGSTEGSKPLADNMSAANQMSRNPMFEVSLYESSMESWERPSATDDCLKLYSHKGSDGDVLRTEGGPAHILIQPSAYAEVILKTIKGANPNSLLTLKLKEGSPIKLMFDRSAGSSLKHGRSQARDFVTWLQRQTGGKIKSSVDMG